MVLQAIKYKRGELEILDQLLLPHHEVYINIQSPRDAWIAIQNMQVRGAPVIAIVAALSLAVFLACHKDDDRYIISSQFIAHSLKYLVTSRPTAVNLADAAKKLERVVYTAHYRPGSTSESVLEAYIKAAEQMLVDDRQDNENTGKFGAEWILKHQYSVQPNGEVAVLTHCNTGDSSLATAGYGTALGVIRSLHARKALSEAFYTETRPYNQGSRLTGYELLHDEIPSRLITDSMAASLMRDKKHARNLSCIVVGADRVTANGDTANKIGTYSLAILARYHGLKFLVAAPRTTIDMNTASGADITIEERSPREVIIQKGPSVIRPEDVGQASEKGLLVSPADVHQILVAHSQTKAWNPAFDVTPADLIDAIVTEKGVVEKGEDGQFHFDSIFTEESAPSQQKAGEFNGDPNQQSGGDANGTSHEPANGSMYIPDGLICWKAALSTKASDVPPWSEWLKGSVKSAKIEA